MLRDYQTKAVDNCIAYIDAVKEGHQRYNRPLITLPTGAGKSYVIASLANVYKKDGHKVVVLQPSKELTEQNYEKYLLTDNPASVFSASISKDLSQQVIFATPISLKNYLDKHPPFAVSAIIIDEAHKVTRTMRILINRFDTNPFIVGLTATPFRLDTGFIMERSYENEYLSDTTLFPPSGIIDKEAVASELNCSVADLDAKIEKMRPYFKREVYRHDILDLINDGYLSTIVFPDDETQSYSVEGVAKSNTDYNQGQLSEAINDQEELTKEFCQDVLNRCASRNKVLVFATDVRHAVTIRRALCGEIITAETPKPERQRIIERFKNGDLKYLVNVAVLTVGFDFDGIDCIVIMRPTKSHALYNQIIGRGLRQSEDKDDCLVLDYTDNIELLTGKPVFDPVDVLNIKPVPKVVTASASIFMLPCHACKKEQSLKYMYTSFRGENVKTLEYYERDEIFLCNIKCQDCDELYQYMNCHKCNAVNGAAARFCGECDSRLTNTNLTSLNKSNGKIVAGHHKWKECRIIINDVMHAESDRGDKMLVVRYSFEKSTPLQIAQHHAYFPEKGAVHTDYMTWIFDSENENKHKTYCAFESANKNDVIQFISIDPKKDYFSPKKLPMYNVENLGQIEAEELFFIQ